MVDYKSTAFYLESESFDPCGGHATSTGSYHYHGTAGCLQEQAGGVVGEHSPLIGWSYVSFVRYCVCMFVCMRSYGYFQQIHR